MAFDEVFPDDDTALTATKNCTTTRFDSAPCGEQHRGIPTLTPISPCFSEESTESIAAEKKPITGKFSDIELTYHVDPRVLGTGYHGTVRECIDRLNGQRYAVKSICKNGSAVTPDGLVCEIELLREMNHESIIELVDVFEDAEYVHLVTDLCNGGELFDKIAEKSSFDNGAPCFVEEEAATIMHQILKAVSYMHKGGIAHRDIKPENILFENQEEDSPIKIIDFGLSRKHYGEFGEPPMTAIVGTPYYIAPEILRKKGYDKSCDLWSVGIIAYILLAGYPPFNGNDNREVYAAIQRGRYHFSSADWSSMSRESRDFIRHLLQRNPRKRMTTEQALNHPWIKKKARISTIPLTEDCQDDSSVEVLFHGSSRRDAIIFEDLNRGETRKTLFADWYASITDRLHREPKETP